MQNVFIVTETAGKLINEQKITHNFMFGQYYEVKDKGQAINDLSKSKHYMISFDKIDPSLVFFHEGGGQEFSIITKDNPNKDEYNKLLQLRKSFVILQNENYKSYGKNV